MSAQLNSGIRSLHLVIPTPYDLVRTTDVRDDLIAVKVWYSTTANFNPLAGQGTLFSETNSLSITITGLETNKVYYVKYALISAIDPTHFTVSRQYSAMTYDENTSIYGYLTNDPTALSTASDGSGGNWAVTQGVFKLYSYSEDVTGKNDFTNGPFYSVVQSSVIGGLVATINNKGEYSASAMTGSSGSVILRAVYKGLTVEKVWNVYKGVAGQTAPTLQLTTPIKEFIYKDVNQKRSTVASTTITATLKNITGTPTWETRAYSREGVMQGSGSQQIGYTVSSDGLSITISNDQFSNPLDYNVDLGFVVVKAKIGVTFDEISIYRICDGSTQIQVEQSNQSHQITTDENGTADALNYIGSGTTISVKKGAQTLLTDNTGTDNFAADTWRVINISAVGITPDNFANVQPTYIEYDKHSAMTADAAYIDYTIRVQITDGTPSNPGVYQDFITRQSFSKSKQGVRGNTARSVNLTYDALAFLTDNKNIPPTVSPAFMTFTATASNYTGAAGYSWYVNSGTGYVLVNSGSPIGEPSVNTFRLYPFPPGETRVVKVVVSENGLSSFDEQGTVSQILGSDGLTAVIYNDTKPVICDQLGEPEQGQFPFSTTFFVARGNNVLNGNSTLVRFDKVSYTGGSSSTYRIDQTSGVITVDSLNANFAEATFTATVGTLVITKKVSFTKYKDGKTPVKGTDYNDGSSVQAQFSQNATTWHDTYYQGDVYIRINTISPTGTVTPGVTQKYIPEKGTEYFDGKNAYFHIKYSNDVTATTLNGVTTYTANSFTSANGETPGDYMGTYSDDSPNDSTLLSMYTWVRIKGEDGVKGPRNASGWLYYQTSATSPPSPPDITTAIKNSWSWSTGTFSTNPGGWSTTPFTPNAGQSAYAVSYYVTETAYGVTPVTVTLGNVTTSITFNGLVTFTDLNNKANASDLAFKLGVGGAAADINNYRNITQINGGAIETGTLNANALVIGDSNTGNSDGKIVISSNNNNIKVYSMNGGTMVPRVIIGNLAA